MSSDVDMAQSCPAPARIATAARSSPLVATAARSSAPQRPLYARSVRAIVLLLAAGCSGAAATVDAGGAGHGMAGSAGGAGGQAAMDAGGSAGAAAGAGDDLLFVPAGISNTNQDGQDVGLVLVAFTLVPGPNGPSFYAAVQNVWSTPLCEAGLMLNFFDSSGNMLGSAAGVLQSGSFYELTDGSGAIIPCVDPGQIAMTGETGLADTIVVDQVGSIVHLLPSFNVGVVAAGPLTVSSVQPIAGTAGTAGTAYTGTVVNEVGSMVSNPSVAVFPVNSVGRPLGMATASATMDLLPGATWTFQTTAVDDPGIFQVAYASASVP
jgi:hypothetical protein